MFESISENIFAYILFAASVITGAAYFYDRHKEKDSRRALKESEAFKKLSKKEQKSALEPHGLIGQTGSLFFVILFVFLFRSFVIEPFRIPSGSMQPTLEPGDFIAVSKVSFGIRNPLTNNVLIETSRPKRGDVIVFKYPKDKTTDYIKRVVGLPGDTIIYQDKHLYILKADAPSGSSPELISTQMVETISYQSSMGFEENYDKFIETFDNGSEHTIIIDPNAQQQLRMGGNPPGHFVVPEDCYFAMGDNRDHSYDSRFWGFVPFENIVGKAMGIWLSLEFSNSSDSSLPGFIPSAVRFDRIGSIE